MVIYILARCVLKQGGAPMANTNEELIVDEMSQKIIDVASYLLLAFGLVSAGLGLILHAKK